MTDTVLRPIGGPAAWQGATLLAERDWIRPIGAVAEIDAALAHVKRCGIDWRDLAKEDFPLPTLSGQLAAIADELESGRGVVKLTGFPVGRYGERDLRTLYFGIGCHLGTPVHQNGSRGLMRDICDNGGTRVESSEALRWHNDRTDVVGLLCVRKAQAGGISRIVSAVAIHDAMQARRPDLLAAMYRDFYRSTIGDEVGGEQPYYPLPIFALRDGYFTS
ncbi:MAG: TauD/TfdA family dioxygenase, partial [Alphaproteobacteria bacterium]